MVREDIVNSAVSFLQDPSVASAPLDKRIAFLNSKNLTQDEINVALARAGSPDANVPGAIGQQSYSYGPPQQQQQPGYGQYPGYWQPPPPEIPRRDWRDWFIMATVVGGVGFGLYVTAQRYILPLIKPPTPPQLTQDKEYIDESFNKAFALLEQLEIDTKALKDAEEARTTRLDTALTELESVVSSLKDSDRKREDDARRNTDEIRLLRDLIPKALESEKSSTETRLKDLTGELKSLKTLMGNRMGGSNQTSSGSHRPTGSFGASSTPITNGASSIARSATPPSTGPTSTPADSQSATSTTYAGTSANQSANAAIAPSSSPKPSSSAFPRFGSGKAAIPAWQMAASKNAETPKADTSDSGTATEEVAAQ